MRLAVIIPCRNEERVIARKLANLSRVRWPNTRAPHLVVVVDDQSDDRTTPLARESIELLFEPRHDVRAVVVHNDGRAGKPGAIRRGLAQLEPEHDLVVLTDADVLLEEAALIELSAAFERDERLAMACGAQRFARDLAADGSLRAADGGALVEASESYDRWTARVRRLEARWGVTWNVHGQLLAWRAVLGLTPREGLAADDIDLRESVRARQQEPRRVELVANARFVEQKTPAGAERERQALRRARAFVQAVRAPHGRPQGLLDKLQRLVYARLPLWAPWLTLLVPACVCLLAGLLGSHFALLVALLVFTLLALWAPGRQWLGLMAMLQRAKRLEARETLAARWEMSRS